MSKVRVLIIEDRKEESDLLISLLDEHQFEVAGIARNHADAVKLMRSVSFDIAVIDVYLGEHPEGIAFAETLNAQPDLSKPFVFLTSSKDRTVFDRAKLTKPFAFLMKPFNGLEVLYALEMALEKYYDQDDAFDETESDTLLASDHFFIKKKGALKKVLLSSIHYVEVDDRYCTLHCEDEKFVVLISLSRIETMLQPHGFVRTHRKFIVQRNKIEQIILGEDTIILEGGQSIPVSDNYKDLTKSLDIL